MNRREFMAYAALAPLVASAGCSKTWRYRANRLGVKVLRSRMTAPPTQFNITTRGPARRRAARATPFFLVTNRAPIQCRLLQIWTRSSPETAAEPFMPRSGNDCLSARQSGDLEPTSFRLFSESLIGAENTKCRPGNTLRPVFCRLYRAENRK